MKSISGISNLISKHWIKAISVFLFIILLGSYINIFAQSNPFNPGETLDPDCLPGEENCIVNIQESASSIQSKLGPASSTTSGYLSSTDWNSFNSKQPAGNYLTSFTETDPSIYSWAKAITKPTYTATEIGLGNVPNLSFSGSNTGDETTLSIQSKLGTASGTTSGYLSSTDWNSFNNKISSQWTTSGNNILFSSGNVGIGTSNINHTLDVNGNIGLSASSYINFGSVDGTNGYGIKDNAGTLQYKNSGGAWANFPTGGISLDTNNSLIAGGGSSISNVNFLGNQAGASATNAGNSNFIGNSAGYNATSASYSNFIGASAGYGSTSASYSNFLGLNSGRSSTSASMSNFLGYYAGFSAPSAPNSNFIGNNSGNGATSASNSNFLGYYAGKSASSASYSNLFGYQAGMFFTDNNIGSNNIIIGTNISLPNATANAINLGGVLFGTGTYSTTSGNPSITAVTTGKIGIATIPTTYTLEVGNSSVSGIVAQFTNSTGYCTINPTTTSLSCSSDISLKKNIYTLDNKQFILNTLPTVDNQSTLDKILTLTPVTYNWNTENDTDIKHIGFIAQDMEQVFPDLVTTDSTTNLKSISYGNLTPYLVKAIQEMNLKITTISNIDTPNIWRDSIIAWLSNATNGITNIFSKEVHTEKLCVKRADGTERCVTGDELDKVLGNPIVESPVQQTSPSESNTPVDSVINNDQTESNILIDDPVINNNDQPVVEQNIPEVVLPEVPIQDTPNTDVPVVIQ